jgi:hypothetical protein
MQTWLPSPSNRTLSTANGTTPSCLESLQLTTLFLDNSLDALTADLARLLGISFPQKKTLVHISN